MKRNGKNRFLCVLLVMFMLVTSLGTLTSCGKKTSGQGEAAIETESQGAAESQADEIEENQTESDAGETEAQAREEKDSTDGSGADQKTDSAFACPSSTGQLQVIGTQLCSQDGNPVQLRGISTHGIAWFPQYVNSEAFAEFRNDWGANVMRLAMYTHENGGYCTDGNQKELLNTIDTGVQAATENDMYVIIDWHVLNEGNPLTYESQAEDFWQQISKKYAANNNVLYEICNEPCNGASWSDIKSYANTIIPIIRANDADAVIIVGTPNWSQEVDKAVADPLTGYDNIMYTLHFYAATHKNDLRKKMEKAIKKGLPVIVTEYGICDASGNGSLDEDSAEEWVSLMDQYGVSYVCWNLSNKAESSALINSSCSKTSGFTTDDLSGEGQWLYKLLSEKAKTEAGGNASFGTQSAGGTDSGVASDGSQSASTGSSNDSTSNGNEAASAGGSATVKSGDFEVLATCSNSWDSDAGTCYQYTCSIKNTSKSAVSSWKVTLSFDGSITLSDGWNGDYTASGSTLTITNKDYNGQIEAGASVTDVGFIVCGGQVK